MTPSMQITKTKTSWKKAHWFWVAVVTAAVIDFVYPPLAASESTSLFGNILGLIAGLTCLCSVCFARPETDYKKDVGMPRMQRSWYRFGFLGLPFQVLDIVLFLFNFTFLAHVMSFIGWMFWFVAIKLWTDAHEVKDPA